MNSHNERMYCEAYGSSGDGRTDTLIKDKNLTICLSTWRPFLEFLLDKDKNEV